MGIMILAKGISPVMEFGTSKFKEFQNCIVDSLYGQKGVKLYNNFSSLNNNELAEWKKLSNSSINKLLLLENRTEISTVSLKKILEILKGVKIQSTKVTEIKDYMIKCIEHCLKNKDKLIILIR